MYVRLNMQQNLKIRLFRFPSRTLSSLPLDAPKCPNPISQGLLLDWLHDPKNRGLQAPGTFETHAPPLAWMPY